MTEKFTVTVSTDGSALNNPHGAMGWAWVEHTDTHPDKKPVSLSQRISDCGGATNGTNQIGELTAVLQCLREHRGDYPLIIETDSQYAINCSTTWLSGWKRNGWKNSKKEPVKNRELIEAIDHELTQRTGSVKFVWVKGHAGNYYNETVDDLARGFAESTKSGQSQGRMPLEGWQVLMNGPYSEGLIVPDDYATQFSDNTSSCHEYSNNTLPTMPKQEELSFETSQEEKSKLSHIEQNPSKKSVSPRAVHTIDELRAATQIDDYSSNDQLAISDLQQDNNDLSEQISQIRQEISSAQHAMIDQPLFHENDGTLTDELITRLNIATERFDLAAQRLQTASEHMDQAVAKLDEAIRRFDDISWKNNHQKTLF